MVKVGELGKLRKWKISKAKNWGKPENAHKQTQISRNISFINKSVHASHWFCIKKFALGDIALFVCNFQFPQFFFWILVFSRLSHLHHSPTLPIFHIPHPPFHPYFFLRNCGAWGVHNQTLAHPFYFAPDHVKLYETTRHRLV